MISRRQFIKYLSYSFIVTKLNPVLADNKKVIKYGPLVACIALGVGKELIDKYDSNPNSTFDWLDIAYTFGGGVTVVSIDINKR